MSTGGTEFSIRRYGRDIFAHLSWWMRPSVADACMHTATFQLINASTERLHCTSTTAPRRLWDRLYRLPLMRRWCYHLSHWAWTSPLSTLLFLLLLLLLLLLLRRRRRRRRLRRRFSVVFFICASVFLTEVGGPFFFFFLFIFFFFFFSVCASVFLTTVDLFVFFLFIFFFLSFSFALLPFSLGQGPFFSPFFFFFVQAIPTFAQTSILVRSRAINGLGE